VQLEGTGVKCIDMGSCRRYTHSPCELMDLRDIDGCAKLVAAAVLNIHHDTDFSR